MPHNFHQEYMDFGAPLLLVSGFSNSLGVASGFDAVHHGTLSIRSLRHDAEARGSFLQNMPNRQCSTVPNDLQNTDFTVAYANVCPGEA